MRQLQQIGVIGMGLLGSSVTLAILRSLPGVKSVGYSHRAATRRKARQLGVATKIVDHIEQAIAESDLVIVATPVRTFESIFKKIAGFLSEGCIVTDVGSTKQKPHQWAEKILPKRVYYVGSHPIAGSEQRGVEFARDDLFNGATCVLTTTGTTNNGAVGVLGKFWSDLGCDIKVMNPAKHDRIFAHVSHVPHLTAAALINANSDEELKLAGKGFMDTSRVASGPVNIWADIFLTNSRNIVRGVDSLIRELQKLQKTVASEDEKQIQKLLRKARKKRSALINYKMKKREIES